MLPEQLAFGEPDEGAIADRLIEDSDADEIGALSSAEGSGGRASGIDYEGLWGMRSQTRLAHCYFDQIVLELKQVSKYVRSASVESYFKTYSRRENFGHSKGYRMAAHA